MSRQDYKSQLRTERVFVTGSSRTEGTDTILTSSYNDMKDSFDNNAYLLDGANSGPMGALVYQLHNIQEDISDMHAEVSASVYTSTVNSGSYISEIKAFTARDATPSVKNGYIFVTANDRPMSITAFDDPTEGQQITIIVKDVYTDFTNGGVGGRGTNRLVLNGNTDWTTCTTGDSISFVHNDGVWVETHRSDNT
tara:strand:- start:1697 stop:2281 length:585 start_codon:yes stop_codon:yes gene_type:complete